MIVSPIFLFTNNTFTYTPQNKINSSSIELFQTEIVNVSIENSFSKLSWIEIQLTITVTSNRTGQIWCALIETEGSTYFEYVNVTENLVGGGVTQKVSLRTRPFLFTLPGKYNMSLIISLVGSGQQYSEEFDVVLGLGYTVILSFMIIFGVAILVIITRKIEIDKEKVATAQSVRRAGRVPEGKIPCPTCHSVIDEGLTFCPECGDRIQEFLRFRPSSST